MQDDINQHIYVYLYVKWCLIAAYNNGLDFCACIADVLLKARFVICTPLSQCHRMWLFKLTNFIIE